MCKRDFDAAACGVCVSVCVFVCVRVGVCVCVCECVCGGEGNQPVGIPVRAAHSVFVSVIHQ